MTNYEKYKDDLIPHVQIGITSDGRIKACGQTRCSQCIFNTSGDCTAAMLEWLNSEYKDKPKITPQEKILLEITNGRYIARDANGVLIVYDGKPRKNQNGYWLVRTEDGFLEYGDIIDPFAFKNAKFDFIKCEDESPWIIEDLLKLDVIKEEDLWDEKD